MSCTILMSTMSQLSIILRYNILRCLHPFDRKHSLSRKTSSTPSHIYENELRLIIKLNFYQFVLLLWWHKHPLVFSVRFTIAPPFTLMHYCRYANASLAICHKDSYFCTIQSYLSSHMGAQLMVRDIYCFLHLHE